jgi:hypothetical protein
MSRELRASRPNQARGVRLGGDISFCDNSSDFKGIYLDMESRNMESSSLDTFAVPSSLVIIKQVYVLFHFQSHQVLNSHSHKEARFIL